MKHSPSPSPSAAAARSPMHASKESTGSAAALVGMPALQSLARFVQSTCEALRAEFRAISASLERNLGLPQSEVRSLERD